MLNPKKQKKKIVFESKFTYSIADLLMAFGDAFFMERKACLCYCIIWIFTKNRLETICFVTILHVLCSITYFFQYEVCIY